MPRHRKGSSIGRNVRHVSLKPRAGHAGQYVFTLNGDRGDLKMILTETEVRFLFVKQSIEPHPDALSFTFHLEPGKVRELLAEAGVRERRYGEHPTMPGAPLCGDLDVMGDPKARLHGPGHPTGGRLPREDNAR